MAEFFNWLSSNPIATTTVIVSFGVVITATTIIYVVAFFQGRSISFWPPSIGERPDKAKGQKSETAREKTQPISGSLRQENDDDLRSNPIVQKGMTLKTASGQKLTI